MINNILLAAAVSISVNSLCAPVLAENVTSSEEVPAAFGNFTGTSDTPPTVVLYAIGVADNIACRNSARKKFFELGARDKMSSSKNNSHWGTIGTNMRAVVWCRETQAIVAVTGYHYDSVIEVRNAIVNAF